MTLDQWKNLSMQAERSLHWEKGGIGVSFSLAKANSVVLRGGIGLTSLAAGVWWYAQL